ncbi:MAG: PIN domain-containing protein, partial [Pseudonocardiaceae bacterium]
MTGPSRGLLDTSVFIAAENGRSLKEEWLPAESAISVVTLAELHAGVLAAQDTETRAVRMTTLDALADIELIPVDGVAAVTWA